MSLKPCTIPEERYQPETTAYGEAVVTLGVESTTACDEIGYGAGETCQQSVEGTAWFLPTMAYSKLRDEKNELTTESLSKTEPEMKDLENAQSFHITDSKETCLEDNTKGEWKTIQ